MPFFSNTPSLSVRYEDNDPNFSYNVLSLSDSFPDANQLKVLWVAQTIYEDNVLINVSSLNPLIREKVQTIPSTGYVVDTINKTITPQWGNLELTVNGKVYRYVANPVISSDEPLFILRSTDISTAEVDFQPGSRLTSEQLNTSFLQNFLAVQELTFKLDNSDLTSQQSVEFINDLADVNINTANDGSFLVVDSDLIIRDSSSSGVLPNLSALGDVQYTSPPVEGDFLVRNGSNRWVPGALPFDLTSFSVTTQVAHDNNSTLTYDNNGGFTFTPLNSNNLLDVNTTIQDLANVTPWPDNAGYDTSILYWDFDDKQFKAYPAKANPTLGLGGLGPFQKTGASTPSSGQCSFVFNIDNEIVSIEFKPKPTDPRFDDYSFYEEYWKWLIERPNYILLTNGKDGEYVRDRISSAPTRDTNNKTIKFTLEHTNQISSGTAPETTVGNWSEVFIYPFYSIREDELLNLADVSNTTPQDNDVLLRTGGLWTPTPVTELVDTSSITIPYVSIIVEDGTSYTNFAQSISLIRTAAGGSFININVTGNAELISAIDDDNKKFIVPETGTYEVWAGAALRPTSIALPGDDYNATLSVQVNGTQVSPGYKDRRDIDSSGSSQNLTGCVVLELQQGDEVEVLVGTAQGGRLSNYNVTIKHLTFNTTLLIDPGSKITARPVSRNRTSDEVCIGISEEGYPLYERYFEITTDLTTTNPVQRDVWDYNSEQSNLMPTNINVNIERFYDASVGAEYYGESTSALFGLYAYTFLNKVRVGNTANAPISTSGGAGSIIGVSVKYTKEGIDLPDAQYILVSSGFAGVTGVTSVNGDPGPDVILSANEIRMGPDVSYNYIDTEINNLSTTLSTLETTVSNLDIPEVGIDVPALDHTHTAADIISGTLNAALLPTFTITADAGTDVVYPTNNNTLDIQGGTKITTTSNNNGLVTIIHDAYTPGLGTQYFFPTGISVDSTGHVTNVTTAVQAFLSPSENLSDLADIETAKVNLGLGTAASANSTDFASSTHTHALGDLSDVDTAGATLGQVLEFDGADWVPATPAPSTSTITASYSGHIYAPSEGTYYLDPRVPIGRTITEFYAICGAGTIDLELKNGVFSVGTISVSSAGTTATLSSTALSQNAELTLVATNYSACYDLRFAVRYTQ